MTRKHWISSVALCGLIAPWGAQASAQDVPQSTAPSAAPALPTEPPKADDPAGDIVVTATRRSESVQRVPISVAAVSGDTLATNGVKDLFQAVTLVPGVVFSRAPDDGLALTFRGLGTTARPQAFEQSVALFTDGVFLGKTRLYAVGFFDVDRMEFIKGTQSTLLGKNASLGAISVVTRQPGDEFSIEGRAGYEFEYGGYQLDLASDMPVSDRVSIRLAAHYNDLNGYVRNTFTDQKGPQRKDLGLRGTVRAELTETLKLTGSYQYADNRQIGASYQLVGGTLPETYGDNALDGRTAQFTSLNGNGDTFHVTRSHVASIKGELDLGRLTLTAQSGYVAYKLDNRDDFDFSVDDSVNFVRNERYRQFTQELRLQSPTDGTFDWMIGGFFLTSHWNSVENQLWQVPSFPPAGGPPPGQLFNGPFRNTFIQDQKAYSAFASGTVRFTDALRLSGGLRYTRETKDVVFGRVALPPLTVWNTIANPPFDPTPLDHDSNFLDGNVSLQYDIAPGVMAYASFGHGSKAGGFVETNTIAVAPTALVGGKVPAALVAAGSAIKDEKVKTYEVGLKTTFLDRRLRFNVAGFWTDIDNFQDTVFTGGTLGFITFNGPARSRGVEVETAFQVTPRFRFDGGLTYADSTGIIQPIDPTTNAPAVDSSGNPILARFRRSQAPKLIFNAGITYETPVTDTLSGRLGATVRRRSSMFNQRQEMFLSEPLTTLDLQVGVETRDKRFGVDLVAKNVTNAIAEDFASPSVDPRFGAFYGSYLAGPNALRTIMLSAHFKY